MSIIGHGVAQGGTYNNNMPGVAAAYTVLKILKERPIIATINSRGHKLTEGLKHIFADTGRPFCISGYPAMFSFAFGKEKITNQRDWNDTDKEYYLRLIDAAIDRGVMPDHDPREPWFLCYAHSDADIDETLNVFQDVVRVTK
jgi:glutamate-1-semialdehyde 2,1-aminomutase